MRAASAALNPWPLGLCAAALLAGGCLRGSGDDSSGQLIFSHAVHAEEAECSDCHGGVEASDGGTAGAFIPKKQTCAGCHEVEEKGECAKCHKGARDGIRFARRDRALRFDHAGHIKRGASCASCHEEAGQGRMAVAGHETCNTAACHARDHARLRCSGCHENLQRGGARAAGALRHGPGFARSHGIKAKQNTRACAQCHDQTYCADCHAGTGAMKASVVFPEQVETGFIHRGDYLSRHAVEARSAPATCRKCHGQQHCRSCHALQGVAAAVPGKPAAGGGGGGGGGGAPRRGGTGRKVHPAGWVTRGSAKFHGAAARTDINRCASCHDRGGKSNCVSCHTVGGMGGKPHPPGWANRDRADACRSKPMCQTCHAAGSGCPL